MSQPAVLDTDSPKVNQGLCPVVTGLGLCMRVCVCVPVHGKLILVQYKTFLLEFKLEGAGVSCIPNHL